MPPKARNICFVTGTRAEFGLMRTTLRAIQSHPALQLQLVVTGMHLSRKHGRSIDQIRADGFGIDATVRWSSTDTSPTATAAATGNAMAHLARAYGKLVPDVVLLVGDRVEAFAAAAAAHVANIPVAHVHGGDRALGQVDDALRHAITKLAHLHLPATVLSADRIRKLGEDPWRIRRVGSPGIDGIRGDAVPSSELTQRFNLTPRRYALLSLHPVEADDATEERRARDLLAAILSTGFDQTVVIYPNNDPGSAGIVRAWQRPGVPPRLIRADPRPRPRQSAPVFLPNAARPEFLGLLRDAAVLVGNSSAGIIEAASFGTPVLNVGPRQLGRERGGNVVDVTYAPSAVRRALRNIWNDGNPKRHPPHNLYGSGRTSEKIARILATVPLDGRLRRKLIAY
jgi:UDP-hydrolysing UDP-N-acetyl-D-glucosamine 2-epimerase